MIKRVTKEAKDGEIAFYISVVVISYIGIPADFNLKKTRILHAGNYLVRKK